MIKNLTLSLLILLAFNGLAYSQCPGINYAMVNSCGTSEGNNEFVVFTTTVSDAVSSYTLYYGSNNPPTQSSTGILPGANATAKTSTGIIMAGSGCTVTEVTSPATVIPANSKVIFIPASFDTTYDVSGICNGGTIYAVYIDITVAPAKWSVNGTLSNSPAAYRYLQVQYQTTDCADSIRQYWNGWPTNADGNFLTWNADTAAIYSNNGCTNIVAPVKLLSFTGLHNGNEITLSWRTTDEVNAKNFVVERSTDGINFSSIAVLAAATDGGSIKNYVTADSHPADGISYYRLKMVDVDGRFSYSTIIKMNTKNGSLINVYPNVATSVVNIEWNAHHAGNTMIQLFDLQGRLLSNKQILSINGFNRSQINVNSLPKAGYLIKLISDGETSTTKFFKQ